MKTAVEWLFNQLSINNMTLDKGTKLHQEMEQKIFEKAKQMEEDQLLTTWWEPKDKSFQDYYNQTFKK
jgi:hypothetical protein